MLDGKIPHVDGVTRIMAVGSEPRGITGRWILAGIARRGQHVESGDEGGRSLADDKDRQVSVALSDILARGVGPVVCDRAEVCAIEADGIRARVTRADHGTFREPVRDAETRLEIAII